MLWGLARGEGEGEGEEAIVEYRIWAKLCDLGAEVWGHASGCSGSRG